MRRSFAGVFARDKGLGVEGTPCMPVSERDMFAADPQTAADIIREKGHRYYSDRVNTDQVKIV